MMNPGVSDVYPFISASMGGLNTDSLAAEPFLHRGGSLPFKKRKLYRSGSGSTSDCPQSEPYSPFVTPNTTRPLCFGGSDDGKIAALALVAAASSSLPVTNASFPGLILSPSAINEHNQSMHVIQDESTRAFPESPASSELSVPHEASPMTKAKMRVHHPPLRSPLPGGCHGRTARNNSYCRRHPCYNGSKYCKLHYQMHVINGMRCETVPNSDDGNVLVDSARDSPLPTVFTDKRFQGLQGEVQCSATTTRGRPCSYVSVNGTRYCFLHADYDSNPPPRRGANVGLPKMRTASFISASESVSGDETAHADAVLLKTPSKAPDSVSSEDSSLSAPWVTPQASSVSEASPPQKARKMKNITMRDGKPVLSSLSCDKWLNKKVMISTGPLVNNTGRVVKWGNGWVTVRISPDETPTENDEGLLHNRRAVELFLVPEEAGKAEDVVEGIHAAEGGTSSLTRCVSRDIDAQPSEGSSLPSRQDTVSPNELSNSQVDVAVAESEKSIDTLAVADTDKHVERPSRNEEAQPSAASSPDFESPSSAKQMKNQPSEEDSLPLATSLMLAQEQGIRKPGFGLLFGTAALERGRRKVHKPTRYEDTAMLEKAKSRQCSEGDVCSPRKNTPMSSPRSPQKSPALTLD